LLRCLPCHFYPRLLALIVEQQRTHSVVTRISCSVSAHISRV
jgi:hypothetical protein